MAETAKEALSPLEPQVTARLEAARKSHPTWLDLAGMGLVEFPSGILSLPNLQYISLENNKLKTVPRQLSTLRGLKEIALAGNPIENLPNLQGMAIDRSIYLRCRSQVDPKCIHLQLDVDTELEGPRFWSEELRSLRNLRHLQIGKSRATIGESYAGTPTLRRILRELARLDNLEELRIRGFPLGSVPESLRALRKLKSLDLSVVEIDFLPSWIAELPLATLRAVGNKISSLPESFANLKTLRELDLSFNPLKEIPQCVFELGSLEFLNLKDCDIREVPEDILRMWALTRLYLFENPVESPPIEVVSKGLDEIREYWRQRQVSGVDYLSEAKLIILGEPGAGKTSLAHKIQSPGYKLLPGEKSTEGIDVFHYEFPTTIRTRENGNEESLQRKFHVNIWDFGGQEIYHATHQFFLTKRSVYVLVSDDRKEDTDFSYWLHVVEMLTDGSPLFIVQNEKQDRTRDINLSSLRARFSNLRGALRTNLDTNRGLDTVVQTLRKELESLPHVGVGLPATWKRVREAIERDKRDFIGIEAYLDICQRHGFTRREDKLQLSGYLHDLGICLHFQEDPLLKNVVILKPSWGTDAVYRVLDDAEVIEARGQFTPEQLNRIWSDEKYAGMQDELLRLMMKFQLCYALEGEQGYIAPQLLSSEQPSYPWEQAGGLVVRYEYGFLPKGILTRFIVAAHHLIADKRLVWKTGVILERDGSRAEVTEEYLQRRLRVRVTGADPHALLAIVDEHLERLHASFSRLQYERYLPCPCVECRDKAEPYGFSLEKLEKMARKSQMIQCHSSGEMVDAGQLVRDVLPGVLRRDEFGVEATLAGAVVQPPKVVPEVFVSYAWNTESCALVDRLQGALEQEGFRLIRDGEEVRYKDSIRDFMRRLGQSRAVVVVISEKYLKSENCMFELLEVAQVQGLRERIFPVVMEDANIYKATGRVRYVQHWETEIRELDQALKTVRGDNLSKLQEDLNRYSEIRRLFDGITDMLRDMSALTPDQHEGTGFEELIRKIRAQVAL